MKYLLLAIALTLPAISFAGNCDHGWQTAADGSKCGKRAADSRPGG